MKRTILLIAIALTALTGMAQIQIQTMYDTTRADGQRFIIRWPYGFSMTLADSLYIPQGYSVLRVREGYYSLNNSTATYKMQRMRLITTGTTVDTIIRYEQVTRPLKELNAAPLLTGVQTKKALKPTAKAWIKYKLNQE